LTVADAQLTSLLQLGDEIEGIGRAARTQAAPIAAQGAVSYSIFFEISPFSSAEKTVAEIVASIQSLLVKLAPVATIETSQGGLTVKTVIHYTGRVASVWNDAPSFLLQGELARAHLDTLQKTYALRIAFARAIASAGGALLSIALAVANPLTALHALASAKALKSALERLAAAVEAARD